MIMGIFDFRFSVFDWGRAGTPVPLTEWPLTECMNATDR